MDDKDKIPLVVDGVIYWLDYKTYLSEMKWRKQREKVVFKEFWDKMFEK